MAFRSARSTRNVMLMVPVWPEFRAIRGSGRVIRAVLLSCQRGFRRVLG